MPDTTCPDCGKPLPSGMPDGMCPNCLLNLGVPVPPRGQSAEQSLKRLRYFGDYELMEEIARGGMGVVWKARQVTLNRVVAVKLLMPGFVDSEERVRRFRTEAEAIASLDHPNIVAIHEVGEHEGQHYFSMEFVPCGDLAHRVARQPLSPREAAECVAQVAAAIHHAHQRGVLHRDLKPANVLIGPNREPRVTDFGLAKLFRENRDLTATGKIMGTPSFMSPEQLDPRRGETTTASDVYGLGAILYYLLTGQPPFNATTLESAMLAILNEEPLPPRRTNAAVPRDLETVCLKCLAKEPARRYGSAAEVAAELERFLNHEPLFARRVSATERAWLWTRRNPAMASVLGLCAAVLAIAAVREWNSNRRAQQARDEIESNVRFMQESLTPQLERVGRTALITNVTFRLRPYFAAQSAYRNDSKFRLLHASFLLLDARYEMLSGRLSAARLLGENSLALLSEKMPRSDSSDWRTNHAAAHEFLRDLYKAARDAAKSLGHGQRMVELCSESLQRDPENDSLKALLAEAHLGLGSVGWEFDLLDVERANFEAGARLAADLGNRSLAEPGWIQLYADSHYYLGRLWGHSGETEKSEFSFQEYLRSAELLVAKEPDNPDWLERVAAARSRVSEALRELAKNLPKGTGIAEEKFIESDRHADLAYQLYEALTLRDPGNVNWQWGYGRMLNWMASIYARTSGEPERAEMFFKNARDTFARLVQMEPEQEAWADELAKVMLDYAKWCREQGRQEDSFKVRTQNVNNQLHALATYPDRPSHHLRLVEAYAALGRATALIKGTDAQIAFLKASLVKLPSTNGAWRWSMAGLRTDIGTVLHEEGQSYVALSEIQSAFTLWMTIFTETPDEARLWPLIGDVFYSLGKVQVESGRIKDAILTARSALAWLKQNPIVTASSYKLRTGVGKLVEIAAVAAENESTFHADGSELVWQCLGQLFSAPKLLPAEIELRDQLLERHKSIEAAHAGPRP